MRKMWIGGIAAVGLLALVAIAGGDNAAEVGDGAVDAPTNPKTLSGPIKVEVRTITTEGMLLNAADKTRDVLAGLGKASDPVTIDYVSGDDGTGLFSLTWNAEKVESTNWQTVEDWAVLNDADEGRFLTMAGSRPVAAWCGQGVQSRMFGPDGSNPGYFEGFCRVMTSNSLPWADYDRAAQ